MDKNKIEKTDMQKGDMKNMPVKRVGQIWPRKDFKRFWQKPEI